MGFDHVRSLSDAIREKVEQLPEYRSSEMIATYVSTIDEVKTDQIIRDSLGYGKRVIVPKIVSPAEMLFSEIRDLNDLEKGKFGILEPKPNLVRPVPLGEAKVILVPVVAWDKRGHRIGHGMGYFDLALRKLSENLKVGLAFEVQRVSRIQDEEHDVLLDMVITEEREIRFKP